MAVQIRTKDMASLREGFLENDHPNEQLQGRRQILQESHGGKPQKLGRAIEPE